MQVPIDYPAAAYIVILGGAIGRRAIIQPKAKDTGWIEVPNLWGAIIGEPGVLKSPAISAVAGHVEQIEKEWREDFLKQLKEWKDGKREGRADDSEKPKPRRLILNDATYEKVQDVMSENRLGTIVIRDELAGLLAAFERKGQESARQFFLTAWNGYSPYTVDRIERGTIYLEHTCLSLIGNIQPLRLREYLAALHEANATNDGMIQRFQVAVWPDISYEFHYTDREPNAASRQWVQDSFDRILKFEVTEPKRFRFSPDAQETFVEWYTQLERRIRRQPGMLTPPLTAHLNKYLGLMPSLALILEIASRAPSGSVGFASVSARRNETQYIVSRDSADLAIRWCKYLESHARRIYSVFSADEITAKLLAEKIKNGEVSGDGSFSCRDVYKNQWKGLKTPEAVKVAMGVLEKKGWIRAVDGSPEQNLGRPSERFEVNPLIRELAAEKNNGGGRRTDTRTKLTKLGD
jgi:putative DNA primase/helicase